MRCSVLVGAMAMLACAKSFGSGDTRSGSAEPKAVTIRLSVSGPGALRAAQLASDCRSDCQLVVESGTPVHLDALPDARASFKGFGSACSGSGSCDLTAQQDTLVSAAFEKAAPLSRRLEVVLSGTGAVRSDPAGIDCPGRCAAQFDEGTVVRITAAPDPLYDFASFGGGCNGTACSLTIDSDQQVWATFTRRLVTLRVQTPGGGRVVSEPAGIDCSSSCAVKFAPGTAVALTPFPAPGYRFAGFWASIPPVDGACNGTGCLLNLSRDITVMATFTAIIPPVSVDGASLTLDPAVALPEPPAPSPDDPATCGQQVTPVPDLSPQPDRPCTAGDGATVYRYDATGRVVYRADHTSYGYDATYTSEDNGGVRIETWVEQGRTSARHVTQLKDGKPIEADHFTPAADGGFVLVGHSTWLYDSQGRQQYVMSQYVATTRVVERNVYDEKGRPYFVDQSQYWLGSTGIVHHSFTARSWFANGALAHEIQTCDISTGPPCGIVEKRWEPCGNLAYAGYETGNWRNSSFTDWSWDAGGRLLTRHDRWRTTIEGFSSTESYQLDRAGRVTSGTILTTKPYRPTEQHETSYTYDGAGRLIERSLDGKTDFYARFDAAGRLVEGTGGSRWTYDGCGR